ncbi:MAG: V-type ATP synthase subunit C [Methanobrevibacter sp.]|nr:V-type ATP synthase subunit C [Methanobrevibacter sp.]
MADELTVIIESFGIPPEALLAIIFVAIVVLGAVVVIIITRPLLEIYPYLLTNAKVRARKGKLFDEKQFSEIIEADDVNEIVNYLRGFPDYLEHLEKHSVEKSLDIQLAKTYVLLARIVPDDIGKAFAVLSKKPDINNIKSLITAKEANLTKEETLNLLVPVGKLYNTCEQLVDVTTVEDIVARLDGTEYGPVLEDSLSQYEEKQMVLPLEFALDKYYLESLILASSVPADENTTILHSYIGSQIDITNLKLIIRGKADGLDYEAISPYIVENGYQIKEWKLKDLMEADNIPTLINGLEGTDYYTVLNEAVTIFNESGSVSIFENALDEYLIDYANDLSLKKPLGIGPIIGYLNEKEKEIKNLKIVVRAKRESGFSMSKIQEMLL